MTNRFLYDIMPLPEIELKRSGVRSRRPKISVVIIARNEAGWLAETVHGFRSTLPAGSEIIVVDDGSTDGGADFLKRNRKLAKLIRTPGLGEARARNLGVRYTTGDIVVGADAHLRVPYGWWNPIVELLENGAVGAVSPAICKMGRPSHRGYGLKFADAALNAAWLHKSADSPYPVPILPGGFMAMRRETYQQTGGFDEGMPRLGSVDLEFSLRLWLLGFELWVVPDVVVAHRFRFKRCSKELAPFLLHNVLRIAYVHFEQERIARVIEELREYEGFAPAVALTVDSDVPARRSEIRSRRVRDAEWYFERFGNRW